MGNLNVIAMRLVLAVAELNSHCGN